MSNQRRTLGVCSRKRPLGPNGERICYNCGGLLPKGRPFNCSSKCSEEWKCKTSPARLRYVLSDRDHGVCALCHVDTVALRKEYDALPRETFTSKGGDSPRARFLEDHGIPFARSCSDWWDADHIVPVVEGGGECGLENYRTLCIPCHKRVTAELRKRIAKRNRDSRASVNDASAPLLESL